MTTPKRWPSTFGMEAWLDEATPEARLELLRAVAEVHDGVATGAGDPEIRAMAWDDWFLDGVARWTLRRGDTALGDPVLGPLIIRVLPTELFGRHRLHLHVRPMAPATFAALAEALTASDLPTDLDVHTLVRAATPEQLRACSRTVAAVVLRSAGTDRALRERGVTILGGTGAAAGPPARIWCRPPARR